MPWGKPSYYPPLADEVAVPPPSPPTTTTPPTTDGTSTPPPTQRRANATILMLARNSDTDSALRSVRELEDRFNHQFHYPWVFLNDEPFTDDFKTRVSNVISGPVEFGVIPHAHWNQPEWVDEEKATAGRNKMVQDNIIYGGSVSYRNMCRFNSGVSSESEFSTANVLKSRSSFSDTQLSRNTSGTGVSSKLSSHSRLRT